MDSAKPHVVKIWAGRISNSSTRELAWKTPRTNVEMVCSIPELEFLLEGVMFVSLFQVKVCGNCVSWLALTGKHGPLWLYFSTLRPIAVGVGLTFDRCLLAFALWLFIHAEH